MQSRNFRLQKVGDINWLEKHYKFQEISFSIDELIILNASRDEKLIQDFSKTVQRLSNNVFIPVAAGGGIRKIEDAEILFNNGADKIILNYALLDDVTLVDALVNRYGSQAIVASIDYKNVNGLQEVYVVNGTKKTGITLSDYIKYIENLQVGEIYLNSIDKDGTGFGYDFATIQMIKYEIHVPLIIAGGAGNAEHLLNGLKIDQVSAVATANLFNFIGDSLPKARKKLLESEINIANWECEEAYSDV